jgi:hypothetical protein
MNLLTGLVLGSQPRLGSLLLEEGWNDVAVPAAFGAWDAEAGSLVRTAGPARVAEYVYDQLADLYGPGCVERISTYNGTGQRFLSFIPGSTPRNAEGNFALMFQEPGGPLEPVGIRLKALVPGMILSFVEYR